MNKNIASIMLANLIIAQSACGMAPGQDIQFSPEQQEACRTAITALATHYWQAEEKVVVPSLAGGMTTLVGSLVALRRAGFSRISSAALSTVAGLAGWAGSALLGFHFISQSEERRLLEQAGQQAELRAIPQQTARQLAERFNYEHYRHHLVEQPYRNVTGCNLTIASQENTTIFWKVKAAETLFKHLALMPREDE